MELDERTLEVKDCGSEEEVTCARIAQSADWKMEAKSPVNCHLSTERKARPCPARRLEDACNGNRGRRRGRRALELGHDTQEGQSCGRAERLIYKVLDSYGGSSNSRKRWGEWEEQKRCRSEWERRNRVRLLGLRLIFCVICRTIPLVY